MLLFLLLWAQSVSGSCVPSLASGQMGNTQTLMQGHYSACAIVSNGQSKCWGYNHWGTLGIGGTSNRGDSANEMGANLPYTDWSQPVQYISGHSFASTWALMEDGTIEGAGYGTDGGFCVENSDDQDRPVTVDTGSKVVKSLIGAKWHVCILADDVQGTEQLYCWGQNAYGQLGHGNSESNYGTQSGQCGDNLIPTDLGSNLPEKKLVATGTDHTCVVYVDNRMKCWGRNHKAQLGLGHRDDVGRGSDEMGDNLPFVDIGDWVPKEVHMTFAATCLFTTTNQVVCWGYRSDGHCGVPGDGTYIGDDEDHMGNNLQAIDFGSHTDGSARYPLQMGCGRQHCCAILNDYDTVCWGKCKYLACGIDGTEIGDEESELGDNFQAIDWSAYDDGSHYAVEVFPGHHSTCVRMDDGALVCIGGQFYGQLGNGVSDTSEGTLTPSVIDLDDTPAEACIAGFDLGGSASLAGATVTVSVDQDPAQSMELSADGDWTFPEKITADAVYEVSLTGPASHSCALGGTTTGTMTADVNDVSITCTLNTYSIGGSAELNQATEVTVSLMISSAVAQTATLSNDDAWTFASQVNHGEAYEVVATAPEGYLCDVSGSSTGTLTAEVNDVHVWCRFHPSSSPSVSPSGIPSLSPSYDPSSSPSKFPSTSPTTIPSFSPSTIPSDSPSYDPSTMPSAGPSAGPTAIPSESPSTSPSAGPTWHPSTSYSLGGTADLDGATVELSVDQPSTQTITLAQDGAFTFSDEILRGSTYTVSASTPDTYDCILGGSLSSTITNHVSDLTVACTLMTFSVGGTAALEGAEGVMLHIEGASGQFEAATRLSADGDWQFEEQVPIGHDYVLSVANPSGYSCSASGFNSTVVDTQDDIEVTCQDAQLGEYEASVSDSGELSETGFIVALVSSGVIILICLGVNIALMKCYDTAKKMTPTLSIDIRIPDTPALYKDGICE